MGVRERRARLWQLARAALAVVEEVAVLQREGVKAEKRARHLGRPPPSLHPKP